MICSNSYLKNCEIGIHSFVGVGSKVMDNCVLEPYSILAAGSVLSENSKVKSNEVWAGSPAKFIRNVTLEEIDYLADLHFQYFKLSDVYEE